MLTRESDIAQLKALVTSYGGVQPDVTGAHVNEQVLRYLDALVTAAGGTPPTEGSWNDRVLELLSDAAALGGGSPARFQLFSGAPSAEGNTGLLDGAVVINEDGSLDIPIAAGDVTDLPSACYWRDYPLLDMNGDVATINGEDIIHMLLRVMETLPTNLYAGIALTKGGMAAGVGNGGVAIGINFAHRAWHSGKVAGTATWAARTLATADTLCPIVWGKATQGNSTNQQRITAGLLQADGITPSATSGSTTALSSGNYEDAWDTISLLVGRSDTTAETLVASIKGAYLVGKVASAPGGADFLA